MKQDEIESKTKDAYIKIFDDYRIAKGLSHWHDIDPKDVIYWIAEQSIHLLSKQPSGVSGDIKIKELNKRIKEVAILNGVEPIIAKEISHAIINSNQLQSLLSPQSDAVEFAEWLHKKGYRQSRIDGIYWTTEEISTHHKTQELFTQYLKEK